LLVLVAPVIGATTVVELVVLLVVCATATPAVIASAAAPANQNPVMWCSPWKRWRAQIGAFLLPKSVM
jgi:hypothetical protein